MDLICIRAKCVCWTWITRFLWLDVYVVARYLHILLIVFNTKLGYFLSWIKVLFYFLDFKYLILSIGQFVLINDILVFMFNFRIEYAKIDILHIVSRTIQALPKSFLHLNILQLQSTCITDSCHLNHNKLGNTKHLFSFFQSPWRTILYDLIEIRLLLLSFFLLFNKAHIPLLVYMNLNVKRLQRFGEESYQLTVCLNLK